MKVNGKPTRTIWLEPDGWSVGIIDQTVLPHRFATLQGAGYNVVQAVDGQDGLDQLSAGLADVKEGNVMTVTYVPGKGTTVAIQGGPSVTVAGKTFADALFRNWLGGDPADSGLKESMLNGH
jgi:hypothetical protein